LPGSSKAFLVAAEKASLLASQPRPATVLARWALFDRADCAVGKLVAATGPGRVLNVLNEAERMLGVDQAVEEGIRRGKSFAEAAAVANYISYLKTPAPKTAG